MIFARVSILALCLATAALAVPSARAAAPAACNRACLHRTLDRFLTAVYKHDPSLARLAANFRQTENAVVVAPGDGIWKTAAGLGKIQRRYFDPVSGQAAYYGQINEPGVDPAVVGMRIKVSGRKITEAEWIIARKGAALYSPEGMIANAPRADTPRPPAERLSRAQLLKVGASYFEGLTAHRGDRVIAKDDCYRSENGTRTTGVAFGPPAPPGAPGAPPPPPPRVFKNCQAGFEMLTKAVESVVERRFPVVDTEAGVVMGIGIFHAADDLKGPDGSPFPRLLLSEFFTVDQDKIETVHAAINYLQPGAPEKTGW
jgi:hypothetical protein